MTMRLPTARRVLVVAPHPDDEAIAAWGLMSSLLRQRAHVEVLVVSDGGASHPGSQRWPRPRLVAERRRETLRSMRTLGLAPPAITFLRLADGALGSEPRQLRIKLARAMRRRRAPELLVVPEITDAHADHSAVADAIADMRRSGEHRISYHVWPVEIAAGASSRRLILKGAALCIKRRIVRSYRTQGGSILDAPTGCKLTHRHLRAFAGPVERFAVIP